MRVLIVSDIHANPWALHAVERAAGQIDHVLCLGDVVNYGPDPRSAITWLRDRHAMVVRGNHDHAVGTGADPRASPAKQPLALAMREWTRSQLDPADLDWLAQLPITAVQDWGNVRFAMCHATPIDPLYDYRLRPDVSNALLSEITAGVQADLLLAGHTHLPLFRRLGSIHILNSGSVGQPLDGDVRAAYAVWDDGHLTLQRAAYDLKGPINAVRRLPIERQQREALISILQTARTS